MFVSTKLIELIRPINSLMVGFAVLVGIMVSNLPSILSLKSLLGFLTGFLLSSYSMVVNDYYDLEVDKINAPNRPLPSGKVSIKQAITFAITLLILGLTLSLLIDIKNFIIAVVFAFIAWIYNFKVKKLGILGNSLVSLSVAIPYIYGSVAVERAFDWLIYCLALTSFLANLGREVVKTIADVEGDKVRGVKSVARVHGLRFAGMLSSTLFLLAVLSTLIPILLGVGIVFTVVIMVPNTIFIYLSIKILKDYRKDGAKKVKNMALVGMLIGLIAFVLGGVFRG
jgi:geranylgeranylglycerol-phosphate geranylgeranyltransferase